MTKKIVSVGPNNINYTFANEWNIKTTKVHD
nr:MAG TPA: hypothetical protein [Microviridae sp.]